MLPIKIELPKGFLDAETRCGFLVTERQKKIWAAQLDLLNELLCVCRRHDIPVQVFAGTLLGAVRHGGYIPWDDDLDVCMTHAAFRKLERVAAQEFKHPYFFQTAKTDPRFFFAFGRLRNSLTTGAVADQRGTDYNNGIYIDIYVMEGYVPNKLVYWPHLVLRWMFVKCLTLYYQDTPRDSSVRERILRVPRPFVRLLPQRFWLWCYWRIASLLTPFVSRIADASEFHKDGLRYWLYKKEFSETIELPFEFLRVPAAKAYEDVLKRIYGDYLQFPPPEARRTTFHDGKVLLDPEMSYMERLGGGGRP